MRSTAFVALAVSTIACSSAPALAQQIQGRVHAADTDGPVVHPTVRVGNAPAFLGGADGTFVLDGLAPGAHPLRVEQIGYAALDTIIRVAAGETATVRLVLTPRVIVLDGLVVGSGAGICARPGFEAAAVTPELSELLDELRKNADRFRLLREAYPFQGIYAEHSRILGRGGEVLHEYQSTDTTRSTDSQAYRAGAVLLMPDPAAGRTSPFFAVPGVQDLASDAFQDTHCFRYAGIETVGEWTMHRLDFVPTDDLETTDVRGSIFLDADRLLLRRSVFELVNLPRQGLNLTGLTVTLNYQEVADGLVVPHEYWAVQQLQGIRSGNQQVAERADHGTLEHLEFLQSPPGGS